MPQVHQEAGDAAVAAKPLVAVAVCGANLFDLHRPIPVGCRRHGAAVGAEADEHGGFGEPLAAQPADIDLVAHFTHFSRRGIADMRVVRPHHRLGAVAAPRQELLERLEHMPVAQVPGLGRSVIHDPVIALGRGNEARILRGIEEIFTVPGFVEQSLFKKLAQHRDHGGLTFGVAGAEHCAAVGRRIMLPGRQAAVPLARDAGSLGIDLVEIFDHGPDGGAHIVDIEPEEACAPRRLLAFVVRAHRADEGVDFLVAPHPGGEALKRAELAFAGRAMPQVFCLQQIGRSSQSWLRVRTRKAPQQPVQGGRDRT